MANQTTYRRIYQFSLLTKTWRSVLALGMFVMGGALIADVHEQIRMPASLAGFVEGPAFFVLVCAGMFFACIRQINGWIRLLVLLTTFVPVPFVFDRNPPFPRDFAPALAVGAMLCVAGLFYLLTALNGRLILRATHFEYRFALRTVRVSYADIVASFKPSWSMTEVTLGLRLKTGKPLIIGTFGRRDASLIDWLDSLPSEEAQAEEREWDSWKANPAYPRVYQNSVAAKIRLTIGALAVGAVGVASIWVPEAVLVKGDIWFAVAFLAPIIMVLVVHAEPRFGNRLKIAWTLGYLMLLPAIFFASPDGVIKGLPAASVPFLRAFGGLCGLHCLFLLVANLRCRLVLHEDRLEYRGFLTTRKVAYADIIETFNPRMGSPFCISLQLRGGKTQRVANFGRFDPAFDEWINGFPNREAEARDRERMRMEGDKRLGTNPDERMTAYRRDLKWLDWFSWPRVALYGWAMCFPRPYEVCMYTMLAVPVLVFLIVVSQRWRWSMHTDNSVYPLGLGVNLAAGAAAVLGLRGMLDYDMMDWVTPLAWSASAALVLMLLVCWIEGRFPWKALASGYFLYLCYAWGGLLFLNISLDHHKPKVEPVAVAAFDNDTKYPTVTIRRADGKILKYKGRIARNGKVGDTVCLYSGRGALGWTWYDGGKCPVKTPPAVPPPA